MTVEARCKRENKAQAQNAARNACLEESVPDYSPFVEFGSVNRGFDGISRGHFGGIAKPVDAQSSQRSGLDRLTWLLLQSEVRTYKCHAEVLRGERSLNSGLSIGNHTYVDMLSQYYLLFIVF